MALTVTFCNPKKLCEISLDEGLHIEDIITSITKSLSIRPLCRQIFGLREAKTLLWLSPSKKLADVSPNTSCQFRIRLFLPSSRKLSELDPHAHEYLFYQVREEFLSARETIQKTDALGLVVTDLLHHLVLSGKKIGEIETKSFMPKSLNTLPLRLNVQKKAENLYTDNVEKYAMDPQYIRERYLDKIDDSDFPAFVPEKYVVVLEEGKRVTSIQVVVDPYNAELPGLSYSLQSKSKPKHICKIEEIVLISIRKQDNAVELCRETGPPYYLKFSSVLQLESFVSCLGGYYRLMKIWSFDLCRELLTPSLLFLRSNKCHGPVGSAFVSEKLKRKGESGFGVLRESSDSYDSYILTVLKDSNHPPADYSIKLSDGKFHFIEMDAKEDRLLDLIMWAIRQQQPNLGLTRILPPSDFDRPEQLLLCNISQIHVEQKHGPRILHLDNFTPPEKTLKGKFSKVYHSKWITEDNKDVAIKIPSLDNREINSYLKVLIQLLFVESDCIVNIFGTLLDPISLVMEYMSLGPLDVYLNEKADVMRDVDLVEAASYLAKALWDLSLKDITHHNIRCHNILVARHESNAFKVKLADPGKVEYTQADIHWIPRKHHQHPSSALTDPHVDIWAFATTLWEIFSLGTRPFTGANMEDVRKLYSEGVMLLCPRSCPKELYKVMVNCWHPELYSRQHPQTIMRDVKQVFYDVFNSRRENNLPPENPYSKIMNGNSQEESDSDDDDPNFSEQSSVSTQMTSIPNGDGSISEILMPKILECAPVDTEVSIDEAFRLMYSSSTPKGETLRTFLNPAPWNSSRMRHFTPHRSLEFGSSVITIGEKIGGGNYGLVFKGTMKHHRGREETVALKRLKSVGNTSDFMKEVQIMQNLIHENIVKLYGLVESCQQEINYEFMVMEYLPQGCLLDYIVEHKNNHTLTSDKKLLSFARDIAMGMDYLENKNIIHRDLAARNVLVASENHVKITDFGLAQRPNEGNYYILRTIRELPIKWYALESIKYSKYSHKTDVWSYGVTCWEIFTRGLQPDDLPNGLQQLIEHLMAGKRLALYPPCHHLIYSKLILPCWDENSTCRPNFSSIICNISELQDEFGHDHRFL